MTVMIGKEIDGLPVFLDVAQAPRHVVATISISKPMTAPPICAEVVAVILEADDGTLLEPIGWPEPGVLPETHTRGATASAQFTFKAGEDVSLKRAIVVLRGNWAEYRLGRLESP